MRIRGDQSH